MMADYHFGFDNDMWVYPSPDDEYEMPDWLEAVRIENQLFVEASDAIAQVRALQRENAKLRELVKKAYAFSETLCEMVENSPGCSMCPTNQDEDKACGSAVIYSCMREMGIEVDS